MVNWTFVELDDTGSTQAVAKGMAAMDAPEGTTVVAKSQSSGQGRLGREWVSPVGGLYMSFIIRPEGVPKPELATLVSALSVAEGIEKATTLLTTIRWPNDVLVNGKKMAGVIAEAQSFRQHVTQIIIGVGVNCNAPVAMVDGLEGRATSIDEELGKHVEIAEVKHAILDSFSQLYDRWKGGQDLHNQWKGRLGTLGRIVSVKLKTEETAFSCSATDVDPEGGLIAHRNHETLTIRPEDLEWLRET